VKKKKGKKGDDRGSSSGIERPGGKHPFEKLPGGVVS